MTKHFIWLPVILTLGIALYNPVKEATAPKFETQNISFSVYKSSDYASAIYRNSSAGIHIIVEKVNNKGKRTKVWDKTLSSKNLSQYASMETTVPENIMVHGVNKNREHLEVTYILIYNSQGNELQMQGEEVLQGTNNKVHISI
jgi:hypothetical protein